MSSRSAFVSAVLVSGLALPLQAHDIYSDLVDRTGASCCDDRDCQPAPYRFTASGLQMFVDKRWIDVPAETVQYHALEGDTGKTSGGHWCGSAKEFDSMAAFYITKCAILPPQSASAQSDQPKFASSSEH
jgi:hypothetical protein